jgi:hypothetical protein
LPIGYSPYSKENSVSYLRFVIAICGLPALSTIPAFIFVIPVFYLVIPAQAGIQRPRMRLAIPET